MKLKDAVKNISYTVSANLTAVLLSLAAFAAVPKILGTDQYGYWQLYMLYASYVGFFHFGLNDGVYLRNGGKRYDELDKPNLAVQFWLLAGFEALLSAALAAGAGGFAAGADKVFVLRMTALNCAAVLPKAFLQSILQSTGRIKEYARSVVVEKILCSLLVLAVLLAGFRDYRALLFCDLAAKTFALILVAAFCRDLVTGGLGNVRAGLRDAAENVRTGIRLMAANIAGMLIVGIVRMFIEERWQIETFAQISLSLTVSNLVLSFVTAVGVAIFPLLKRTDESRWPESYRTGHDLVVPAVVFLMCFFHPAKELLALWLPRYAESLRRLAYLFPLCLFESKTALLTNTFLKALRRENALLWANAAGVAAALLYAFVTVRILGNLDAAVYGILGLSAFRATLSESFLAKALGIRTGRDSAAAAAVAVAFVFCNGKVGGIFGFGLYLLFAAGYGFAMRRRIRRAVSALRAAR